MPPSLLLALQHPNVQAFLHTIRRCEGTDYPDGYHFVFGSREDNTLRNTDLSCHPGTKYAAHYRDHTGHDIITTAAGAYQFIHSTWQALQAQLSLPDFSPASQDLAAAALLSEKNCLQPLLQGDLNKALQQAAAIWASLPASLAHQPVKTLAQARQYYEENGGSLA